MLAKTLIAAGACLLGTAAAGDEVAAWQAAAEDAMRDACAIRGLALRAPVRIRPMSDFKGGYTAGIGSVEWQDEHARTWRDGWCALGIYCMAEPAAVPEHGGGATPSEVGTAPRLRRPAGLYDGERHTLFVRDDSGSTLQATVAHEATHALQHHNFPALNATHLWYNRDLAAAASAAREGDAHVVGWSFDPRRRMFLCSIDPRHAQASHARWWNWRADGSWAHEGFGHVFGPQLALARQVAGGNRGVDALLREPPLSTLAVLDPERAAPVEFIALPERLAESAAPGCEVGLRNTAGVVGIWGLLLSHGDEHAEASTLPGFLRDWRGDRFAHVACPGDDGDGLVWATRWRTVAAAREFAARYRRIAASVRLRGGVLAGVPRLYERGSRVIVATPELGEVVDDVAESRVEAFRSYSEWIASGCFPQRECVDLNAVEMPPASQHVCAAPEQPPAGFGHWLDRVRRARHAFERVGGQSVQALDKVREAARDLASFCGGSVRDADLERACSAAATGVRYLAGVLADPAWRLLPYCAADRELSDWVVRNYYAASDSPLTSSKLFANVYGPSLAARALRAHGVAGLNALLAAPPISTLHVLDADFAGPIDILRLPRRDLATRGCRVAVANVRGVLGIWDLLVAHGRIDGAAPMPTWLGDWRGDRLSFMHCDNGGTDWVWVSRWRTEGAAADFAGHYRAMHAGAADGRLVPAGVPRRHGRTVWIVPPAFQALLPLLVERLTRRSVATFAEWVASGCFPQRQCHVAAAATQAPKEKRADGDAPTPGPGR